MIVGLALEPVELAHRLPSLVSVGYKVLYAVTQAIHDGDHEVGELPDLVQNLLFLLLTHGVQAPSRDVWPPRVLRILLNAESLIATPSEPYSTRFRTK